MPLTEKKQMGMKMEMFLFTVETIRNIINKIIKKEGTSKSFRESTDEVKNGGLLSTCYVMNVSSPIRHYVGTRRKWNL